MGMYDDAAKLVGSGLYLKLDAGEKRIRIIEDPYVSNRAGFKPEDPIRTVFTRIVWNYDEKRFQVLEQGPGLFKQIAAIVKTWGDDMPMKCDLVVTTTGAGLETRRTVVPVPAANSMPDPAPLKLDAKWPDIAQISGGVPLARFAEGEKPEVAGEPAKPTHKDVVVDELPDGPVNLDEIPF